MSHFSNIHSRGILRNSDQNTGGHVTSQSINDYFSDEIYSQERSRDYHHTNTSIFGEDEDLIQRFNSKSQNVNASLYAEALAAKSSLGLLDVGNCSAIEALRSYDTAIPSPDRKKHSNPQSSQMSRNTFQHTPSHHSSFYDELEEDLALQKYSGLSRNLDTDQPINYKPLVSLDLNTVDDEDEFLYGGSNPVPDETSSFQNESTNKVRANEVYSKDDLLDLETPGYDKYQKSHLFSKSRETDGDSKSGIKLNISTFKKHSPWNYNDDPIVDNRRMKQETPHTSKKYKETFEAYSNSPSALNEEIYETHSHMHYKSDIQSRQKIPFETGKESSFAASDSLAFKTKLDNSSLTSSASSMKNELILDKSVKNNMPNEDYYSKYNELSKKERRVIYDSEKKSVDKSLSNEPLKFPKLLINVQKGDSSPSKRVVQVKDSTLLSNKYNVNVAKSESSINSKHNFKKSGDTELYKNDYKPDDLESRRVIREKTKANLEPISVSSKNKARVLPKRYLEKSPINDEDAYTKRLTEKLPKKYSDKYHYYKEGMEPYSLYGSKSKILKQRSPERHWSPNDSPKHKSGSISPRRRSPEYYRQRSPSYSPPRGRSHRRSPSHHYRNHSPSYRSRDPRRRSSERSTRRERRSHERSPHGYSRYHSRGRSPSWPKEEKDSQFLHDDSPLPSLENKMRERLALKRKKNYSSDEPSDDDDQGGLKTELSDKFKGKDPIANLKESDSLKSNVPSKKSKISIDENRGQIFQKSQHLDTVSKIAHDIGITKNASVSFFQKEQGTEITSDSKDKRSEMMNSLLNKLGLSSSQLNSSTSTVTTTIASTPSWTDVSTVTPAPVSATAQQLNVSHSHQYDMNYTQLASTGPQQFTSTASQQITPPMPQQLSSAVPQQLTSAISQQLGAAIPQIYPQYMYGSSSVPTVPSAVSHFPPYHSMYPPPLSSASTFSYAPPAPATTNTFSSVNFQNNSTVSNPNSHGRISCLKSIPVVNSESNSGLSMSKPSPSWNQNNQYSPTKQKISNSSRILTKTMPSKNAVLETNDGPAETEENMIERYRKCSEDKETLQQKLKNTSDHIIRIKNLKADLEKKSYLPKSKQIIIKCTNLFEKANEELKRYIDEARQVKLQVKELETKIKPAILEKLTKEVPEKKSIPSNIRYTGYDTGGHWCEICNIQFPTILKMMEHLHTEIHTRHVDPLKVITNESPKDDNDNGKLFPVKGVEFIKPLYAFYCSLCNETMPNQSCAECHLKGNSHIQNYLNFLKENPVYERKRELFQEVAAFALANVKRQKDLEDARLAKRLIHEKHLREIKLKKIDTLETTQEKSLVPKEIDKEFEELEESISYARNLAHKSNVKLTLANEKSKTNESQETIVSKAPEEKPKPKVVYIGRAPNYKPRQKTGDKKVSKSSEIKNTCLKTNQEEESKNSLNVPSKEQATASDLALPTDDKFKAIKNKLSEFTQKYSKNRTASPKRNKILPGCQSEVEAKASENATRDLDKQSTKSSEMPTDNSEINQAIQNFIRSHKNATSIKVGDPSGIKSPDVASNIPSRNSESSSKVPNPKISSPKVCSPQISNPQVSNPVVTSSNAPPLPKKKSMTEEEKDFLILGISKSDMEPLATPRPPPTNLIQNRSDMVPKFQSFLPPIQVPPPNIISKVPPPNIVSQVPPPNITSQVPPPNIITKVPPPNITSQVPPPNLVLQWSEQKQQSNSLLSNVTFSRKLTPCISKQPSRSRTMDENSGVMDMEIDNDLIYSEIKVGSSVSSENELSTSGENVMNEQSITSEIITNKPSLSSEVVTNEPSHSSEIVTNELSPSSETVMNKPSFSSEMIMNKPSLSSGIVIKEPSVSNETVMNEPSLLSETVIEELAFSNETMNESVPSSSSVNELITKSNMHELNSEMLEDKDDDRSILKNFLSSLMDSVSEKVLENIVVRKSPTDSSSENSSLSDYKAMKATENSPDDKFNVCTLNIEQSAISFSQSETLSAGETISTEINAKDMQTNDTLVTIPPEICNNGNKICIDDIEDIQQNNIIPNSHKVDVENNNINNKEENLPIESSSNVKEDFYDDKMIGKPLETETCDYISASSEIKTSCTDDNEKDTKDKMNMFYLNTDLRESNSDISLVNSISASNDNESFLEEKVSIKLIDDKVHSIQNTEVPDISNSTSSVITLQETVSSKEDSIAPPTIICSSENIDTLESSDSESQHHNKLFSVIRMHEENIKSETEVIAESSLTSPTIDIEMKEDAVEAIKEPIETLSLENTSFKKCSDIETEIQDEDLANCSTFTKVIEETSSTLPTIEFEVKEETRQELKEPIETLYFENLSFEKSPDMKIEKQAEGNNEDLVKCPSLTEDVKTENQVDEFNGNLVKGSSLSEVNQSPMDMKMEIQKEENNEDLLQCPTSDMKIEIQAEEKNEDLAKCPTLTEVNELSTNMKIKNQVEEFNEDLTKCTSLSEDPFLKEEGKGNMDELKQLEDSQDQPVPFLKKYDTDDVSSEILTDEPPLLSVHEESTIIPFVKELKEEVEKVKADSDTDEYEAGEN